MHGPTDSGGVPEIGGLRLVERVGEGSVSHVWRAVEEQSGRTLAVKILRKSVIDLETVQRLAQEVAILSQLHHPCIVSTYGSGVAASDEPYLLMEWIEGMTLRDRLDEQPEGLAVADVVDVVNQLCSALGDAHEAEVIHRDLKPENVILCAPEYVAVKILDFGMANVLRPAAPNLTVGDNIFGTPQYMSPERARGQPVTAASDVYAVAVMTYEMLSGRRPFDSPAPMRTLLMHVKEPVPAMPEVAPPLAEVVCAAMAKDPAGRPGAAAFAHRLEEAARSCGALAD